MELLYTMIFIFWNHCHLLIRILKLDFMLAPLTQLVRVSALCAESRKFEPYKEHIFYFFIFINYLKFKFY